MDTEGANSTDRSRERLRVALFSGNYNYVMDGPVRALNTLVAYLEKTGHEVLIFAPTTKEPAFQHEGTLVSVPSVALPGRRSEYRLGFGLRRGVLEKLEAFRPNLIHIAAPDYTGYSALKYGRKNAIPVVASFHTRFDTYPRYYGLSWLEKYLTRYMRRFYGQCEHVYAPSHSMVDELRRDGIGEDIRLWTRGVDSELFNPAKRDPALRAAAGFSDDDVVIAFVGRVVLEKGIDVFADAISKLQQTSPNVKALVVGNGPERAHFEKVLPGAHFAGYLQGEPLARAYASADIFFNPSITETFGNVTLEAMASGLPSVCAKAAGSKSLVEDGVTGYLAAPNSDAFAEKLSTLIKSAETQKAFGKAARAHSLEFAWDAVLASLVDNYYEAIAAYNPTSPSAAADAPGVSHRNAA